jgi:hypothetical protein
VSALPVFDGHAASVTYVLSRFYPGIQRSTPRKRRIKISVDTVVEANSATNAGQVPALPGVTFQNVEVVASWSLSTEY